MIDANPTMIIEKIQDIEKTIKKENNFVKV